MKVTATIDSTGETVTLTKGSWSGTFPVSELPKWLNFYRHQQARFPAYSRFYEDDAEVLEALSSTLTAQGIPS